MDFAVGVGEIHALLGENGAGKTTLVKVLVGLGRPDAGAAWIAGERVDLRRYGPRDSARRGIGMVHQHSALVPALTAVENLCFGDPRAGFWFRPERARERVSALAERFALRVPLDRRVEDLSVGERQRVEILRALGRGARLLILDEPTAVLTPAESERLFESLRALRDDGCAIVFISHKLAEVEALADRVTVLRRGRVTAARAVGDADALALGRWMLGRDLPPLERLSRAPGETRLSLCGLCAPGLTEASRLRGIDLSVRAGEIVAVVGIDGNGQRELEEVLAGVRRPTSGEIRVGGRRVAPEAAALQRAGVAHLSGDRESAGLVSGFSLAENLILKRSAGDARFFRRGVLDLEAARAATRAVVAEYGIAPPDPDGDIALLSGGNAQKLAVARELEGEPAVLVAVNPTRGLDVGSARFVHERLLERRERGGAVLLVSTELDEALALADRVVALVRGEIAPVPPGSDRAALGAVLLGEARA